MQLWNRSGILESLFRIEMMVPVNPYMNWSLDMGSLEGVWLFGEAALCIGSSSLIVLPGAGTAPSMKWSLGCVSTFKQSLL